MAMCLVWKVTEACKPRGRLIQASEWEKHKDDIIRVYLSSSLKYVVEWMVYNRDFHAT